MGAPVWSEALQCHWLSWAAVDDDPHALILILPPQNVPDMSGTVRLAKRLMPQVSRISVRNSNGAAVHTYERRGLRGRWFSARAEDGR